MTIKGARRIYRKELFGWKGNAGGFRSWVREVVRNDPSMGIGLTGKLDRIVRGPTKAAGTLVR